MTDLEALYVRVFDTGAELTAANRNGDVPAVAVLLAAGRHIRALERALDARIAYAGLPARDTDLASMELQGRVLTAERVRGDA